MASRINIETLQNLINEGLTLTEIADRYGYSVARISQLAKEWELENVPNPGHREGVPMSDETRIKMAIGHERGKQKRNEVGE